MESGESGGTELAVFVVGGQSHAIDADFRQYRYLREKLMGRTWVASERDMEQDVLYLLPRGERSKRDRIKKALLRTGCISSILEKLDGMHGRSFRDASFLAQYMRLTALGIR